MPQPDSEMEVIARQIKIALDSVGPDSLSRASRSKRHLGSAVRQEPGMQEPRPGSDVVSAREGFGSAKGASLT